MEWGGIYKMGFRSISDRVWRLSPFSHPLCPAPPDSLPLGSLRSHTGHHNTGGPEDLRKQPKLAHQHRLWQSSLHNKLVQYYMHKLHTQSILRFSEPKSSISTEGKDATVKELVKLPSFINELKQVNGQQNLSISPW